MKKKEIKRPFQIGLQMHSLYDDFGSRIYAAVNKCSEDHGINLVALVGETPHTPYYYNAQNSSIYQYINPKNFDGFIFLCNAILSYESLDYMKSQIAEMEGNPIVCIGYEFPDYHCIMIDNKHGIHEAFKHLIEEHNHKNIAFIRGPDANIDANQRFEAYLESLKRYNIPYRDKLVYQGDFTDRTGRKAITYFISNNIEIDAVLTSDDNQALGVIDQSRLAGIHIPTDLAVIGFDNTREAEFLYPPLTTVNQLTSEIGKKAVECLIGLMEGKHEPNRLIIPTQLIVRNSCGCSVFGSDWENDNFIISDNLISLKPKNNIYLKERFIKELSGKISDEKVFNNIYPSVIGLVEILLSQKSWPDKKNLFLKKFLSAIDSSILLNQNIACWESAIKTMVNNLHLLSNQQKNINDIRNFLSVMVEYLLYLQKNSELAKWIRKENRVYELRDNIQQIEEVSDLKGLTATTLNLVESMNYRSFFLCLHNKPQHHEFGFPFATAKRNFFFSLRTPESNPDKSNLYKVTFPGSLLLPPYSYPADTRYSFIVYTIYFKEEIYGYVVFESPGYEKDLFQIIISSLSSTIKRILLFRQKETAEKRLRSAMKRLSLYNINLKDQSERDELTGLLNRRGLMNLAKLRLKQLREEYRSAVLFIADMDDLKYINDTYGHHNGDFALRSIASILRNTFRDKDIIARLGGDEFIILAPELQLSKAHMICERLKINENELNLYSEKPFRVSASLGYVNITPDSDRTLESWMSEADEKLYEEKKKRREAGLHQ
jgi:diguanylate cyclase (GGDEF)-like protein